jgi:TctA family transporter
MIKSYAQDGAAFASVVTELVVMIVQVVLVKRFLNVAIDISNITKILLSSLFMALILLGVNKWSEMEGHLELIIEVLLGLSSYILITVIFKEKSIMIIVHKTQDILNNVFIHG